MNMVNILRTFLCCQSLPKGMDSFHKVVLFLWLHHTFHSQPNIFNGFKVWRWGRCHHHIFKNPLFLHPLSCWLAGVLPVIVLRNKGVHFTCLLLHILNCKCRFENFALFVSICLKDMCTVCFWNGEPKVKGESKLVTLLLLNYCKTKGKADQINSSIFFGLGYSKGKKRNFLY